VIELSGTLVIVLILVTIGASIEYYRQIRKTQREYENAKSAVENIVLSFNRELRREAERLELVAYKVEGNNAREDTNSKRIDSIEMKVEPLESLLSVTSENNQGIVSKVTEVDTKVQGIELAQERLIAKIMGLEDEMQKFTFAPEMKSEPVMPIRRDKALATLTETEIMVLEMLLSEGSKTAPEIKERVGLSREHTARLMKKLYEEGYLERETGKIPFRYSAKQELEKFLKKPENQQA